MFLLSIKRLKLRDKGLNDNRNKFIHIHYTQSNKIFFDNIVYTMAYILETYLKIAYHK